MPTYKGVQVWIEDSRHRKHDQQEVTIDVDDQKVSANVEMQRNELYTVHCQSPVSVFCEVFVTTAYGKCTRGARFHLDKSLAASEGVSGSSVGHNEGRFSDFGLRTPKRQYQNGKLGSVEVKIRRIGEIVRSGPGEGCNTNGGSDEGCATEFCLLDDFDQPPWLIFHFDIETKDSLVAPASTTGHTQRRVPHKNHIRATNGKNSSTGPRKEIPHEMNGGYLHNSKKRPRCDESANAGEDPIHIDSERLVREYQKEEAEERRLLQKLQGVGTIADQEIKKLGTT